MQAHVDSFHGGNTDVQQGVASSAEIAPGGTWSVGSENIEIGENFEVAPIQARTRRKKVGEEALGLVIISVET